MNARDLCACVFAIVAVLALLLLFYLFNGTITGAVASGICPEGSAPILAEGPGKWLQEIREFERRGHQCFWGPDGVTPCCSRTAECCWSFMR